MESLFINGTANTPTISFEPNRGLFEISGKSKCLENDNFYDYLKTYLLDYKANPGMQTIVKITFENYDIYSLNKLYELLSIFEHIQSDDNKVFVYWCYENRDTNLIEISNSFNSKFSLPFMTIESVF